MTSRLRTAPGSNHAHSRIGLQGLLARRSGGIADLRPSNDQRVPAHGSRGDGLHVFQRSSSRETVDGVHYVREGTKFTVFHSAKVYLAKHGGDFDVVLDTVNQRPFLAHEIVGNKATALVYHLGLETWNSEFGFPFNVVGRKVLEPEWMRRLRSAPRVLAISESTAESLAHYGVACDGIVPPALSPKDPILDRVPGSPPRVLFIGRLVNNKRPLDAVRAFELMREEFPGYLDGHRRRRVPHRPDPGEGKFGSACLGVRRRGGRRSRSFNKPTSSSSRPCAKAGEWSLPKPPCWVFPRSPTTYRVSGIRSRTARRAYLDLRDAERLGAAATELLRESRSVVEAQYRGGPVGGELALVRCRRITVGSHDRAADA